MNRGAQQATVPGISKSQDMTEGLSSDLILWVRAWPMIWYAVGDGQGGLACCDSWGRKESDAIERLI